MCLLDGVLCWDNLEVHHIIPLAEDFDRRLDDENLITLCQAHHKAAERGDVDRDTLFAVARASPRVQASKIRKFCKTTRPLR